MDDKTRTAVDLGNGKHGRERLAQLRRLARESGSIGQRGPSLSVLLQRIADGDLPVVLPVKLYEDSGGGLHLQIHDGFFWANIDHGFYLERRRFAVDAPALAAGDTAGWNHSYHQGTPPGELVATWRWPGVVDLETHDYSGEPVAGGNATVYLGLQDS